MLIYKITTDVKDVDTISGTLYTMIILITFYFLVCLSGLFDFSAPARWASVRLWVSSSDLSASEMLVVMLSASPSDPPAPSDSPCVRPSDSTSSPASLPLLCSPSTSDAPSFSYSGSTRSSPSVPPSASRTTDAVTAIQQRWSKSGLSNRI